MLPQVIQNKENHVTFVTIVNPGIEIEINYSFISLCHWSEKFQK